MDPFEIWDGLGRRSYSLRPHGITDAQIKLIDVRDQLFGLRPFN
jgi:hypothetical protein